MLITQSIGITGWPERDFILPCLSIDAGLGIIACTEMRSTTHHSCYRDDRILALFSLILTLPSCIAYRLPPTASACRVRVP